MTKTELLEALQRMAADADAEADGWVRYKSDNTAYYDGKARGLQEAIALVKKLGEQEAPQC